ncbi:hypothetical protein SEA_HEATHER_50 [Streptomyces phage Heather]|uniref:Uncharacterized protein n=1 Tax=Streptomyces phage Heather TaxID=2562343 RepID=A0A4D6E424_9CAUD|nr:hypothetical protein SEA_HEATHER_50 [Streptomyces phage Heather]
MWFKANPHKPELSPAEKTIRRTRRVLTGGRWFLITGLVFYSLMTTTPFVSAHSEWEWSGFVLGLIVDAAFIMALSAESTLARHGVTKLGKWPVTFRWTTGLSSVFLNVWLSVAEKDGVGVAVHLIAPALVMLLAEVGPVYMAALADAEHKGKKADAFALRYETQQTIADAFDVPHELTGLKPIAARFVTPGGDELGGVVTMTPAEPEPVQETLPEPEPVNELHNAEPEPEPANERLSNKEADEIIEKGWRHRLSPEEVGKAATRHPATVRRKYKELDASLSV